MSKVDEPLLKRSIQHAIKTVGASDDMYATVYKALRASLTGAEEVSSISKRLTQSQMAVYDGALYEYATGCADKKKDSIQSPGGCTGCTDKPVQNSIKKHVASQKGNVKPSASVQQSKTLDESSAPLVILSTRNI